MSTSRKSSSKPSTATAQKPTAVAAVADQITVSSDHKALVDQWLQGVQSFLQPGDQDDVFGSAPTKSKKELTAVERGLQRTIKKQSQKGGDEAVEAPRKKYHADRTEEEDSDASESKFSSIKSKQEKTDKKEKKKMKAAAQEPTSPETDTKDEKSPKDTAEPAPSSQKTEPSNLKGQQEPRKRKRTKTRSKQKNMKKDTRPESIKPGGSKYVAKTIVTQQDLERVRRPKNLPSSTTASGTAAESAAVDKTE